MVLNRQNSNNLKGGLHMEKTNRYESDNVPVRSSELTLNKLNSLLEVAKWENSIKDDTEKQIEDFVFSLIQLRKEKKLTQHDLAQKANLAQTTISRIETLQTVPSIAAIFGILKALDCKIVILPNTSPE